MSSTENQNTAGTASNTVAVSSKNPAPVQRKRRRRPPASGAAEDCFTCRKRQTKCDRKRPYCTQCIEMGKECSGYRMPLTWGVGVASRGKLRGMSLPIPKSAQTSAARDKTQSTTASAPARKAPTSAAPSPFGTDMRASQSPLPSPSPSANSFDLGMPSTPVAIAHPMSTPPPSSGGWHVPGFEDQLEGFNSPVNSKSSRHYLQARHLHRLQTSMAPSYDETPLSASTGTLSTYGDSDFPSPGEYPQTPEEFPFVESLAPAFSGPYLQAGSTVGSHDSLPYNEPPRSYPAHSQADDLSSSLGSTRSFVGLVTTGAIPSTSLAVSGIQPLYFGPELTTADVSGQDFRFGSAFGIARSAAGDSHGLTSMASDMAPLSAPPIPRSTYPSHCSTISNRTQFLLDYYDKAICPMLVAFDGPSNPYRVHVMHLAQSSECLQNAIAALATNNIRMKAGNERVWQRYQHQRLMQQQQDHSGVEDPSAGSSYANISTLDLRQGQGEPTAEELHYKVKSVNLLNVQLANRDQAKDDAVLATLMVLCLFHVSDSGVSRFKTQLTGVQKLLKMREQDGMQSNLVRWIELFFTWIDVLTSTVNDRECQARPESIALIDSWTGFGGSEQLTGCEGNLFKLIARLGRLNQLTQHKLVRHERTTSQQVQTPQTPTTPTAISPTGSRDYYSFRFDSQMDVNTNWSSASPQRPGLMHRQLSTASSINTTPIQEHAPAFPTPQADYWNEWNDLRQKLQDWQMPIAPPTPDLSNSATAVSSTSSNTTTASSMSPSLMTPQQQQQLLTANQRDLLHSSEAFRYAALLYTERLARPSLPPHALNFQTFVTEALYHVQQIPPRSPLTRFLLWPLFVVGTEAVDEQSRNTVKQRCLEVQRESGFANNLVAMEVLERVWREEDAGGGGGVGGAGGAGGERGWSRRAGRWRVAMDRQDGEYVLV